MTERERDNNINAWKSNWEQTMEKKRIKRIKNLGSKKNLDNIKDRYQQLLKSLSDRREKESNKLQVQIDQETSGSKKI